MGLILNEFNIHVKIELDNGIYKFTNASATGKSFLYQTMSMYLKGKIPVFGVNYTDYLKGITLKRAVEIGSKLTVIDRYDMYKNVFNDDILLLGKTGIVLIDCKSPLDLPVIFCTIHLPASNIIEVW